jgi:hypothetical protein
MILGCARKGAGKLNQKSQANIQAEESFKARHSRRGRSGTSQGTTTKRAT